MRRQKIKVYCQLKQLESSFNPEASRIIENIEQGREILLDQVNFALLSASPSEVDPLLLRKDGIIPLWRTAINKELGEINNKSFGEIIRRTIK